MKSGAGHNRWAAVLSVHRDTLGSCYDGLGIGILIGQRMAMKHHYCKLEIRWVGSSRSLPSLSVSQNSELAASKLEPEQDRGMALVTADWVMDLRWYVERTQVRLVRWKAHWIVREPQG
jgi:hypothetical protein